MNVSALLLFFRELLTDQSVPDRLILLNGLWFSDTIIWFQTSDLENLMRVHCV